MKEVAAALSDWLKGTSQVGQVSNLPSVVGQVSNLPVESFASITSPKAPVPLRPVPLARRKKIQPHVWILAAAGSLLLLAAVIGIATFMPDRGPLPAVPVPPGSDQSTGQTATTKTPGARAPASTSPPSATPKVPADAVIFQGHEYKYFAEQISWKEAQRRCRQMGGHLPIVESSAENTFLARMADGGFPSEGRSGNEAIWLGATDEADENEWRWTDGKRLIFANWDNGQPNNKNAEEHYAVLWLASDPARFGRWSDQPNVASQHTAHFICEWDNSGSSATAGVWINLFNGRDLSGWRRYADDSPVTGGWVVEDGAIRRSTGGGDIMTAGTYRDFELEFEWKIAQGGNSGVIYRAQAGRASPWQSGPEYQVLDDAGHPNGRSPLTSAGSIYAIAAPAIKTLRPVGQWNTARIVARGTHLAHWLNGEKVVDIDTDSQQWATAAAKVAFARNPGFAANAGHICLQDHGAEVWYRNLRLREL
jgi:hypothetical protein